MSTREPRPQRRGPPMKRRSSSCKKGAFASITARKAHPSEQLGVSIKEVDGRATVTEIFEDSIFFQTDLKVGDILLSLNGTSTRDAFLSDLIASGNAAEEKVTMVVRQDTSGLFQKSPSKRSSLSPNPNEVEAEKEKDQDVGIRFKVLDNKLMVSSILPCSVFQDTDLKVGDLVSKINEMDFYSYADADYALKIANKRGSVVKLQLLQRNL
ncbi:unnamed protein product [Cylindrotheca closterium]|uniref:PDZ domain-containing protein n=1 Tax=Cylindrotheca closterium TaxID=2856 RepID=A0AAD2GAC1_9STRA|nr:unnamed protein product [Cylindrotheca closterium]